MNEDNNLTPNDNEYVTDNFNQSDNPSLINENDNSSVIGNERPNKSVSTEKIFFSVFALVIAALVIAIGVVSFGGSKSTKFLEMLTDDYIFERPYKMMKLEMKDGVVNSEVSVDLDDLAASLGKNNINVGKISINQKHVKMAEDYSGVFAFKASGSEFASIKYAKTGDTFGIAVPGLMDEYFSIRNKNLKQLFENLGLDSTDIPDKFVYDNTADLEKLKEYKKIFKPYLSICKEYIENNLVVEKNVEFAINGNTYKTKRTALKMSNETLSKLLMDIIDLAKDDRELYNIVAENSTEQTWDSFEDYQEELTDIFEQIKESYSDYNFEAGYLVLSAYQYKGDTIAIEFNSEDIEDMSFSFVLAAENKSDNSYIELLAKSEGDIKTTISLNFIIEEDKDKFEGVANLETNVDGEIIKIKLVTFKEEYSKDMNNELEKITTTNSYVINDQTSAGIQNKLLSILSKVSTYTEGIVEKLPEGLSSLYDNTIDDNYNYGNDDNYDDYDYNYNYSTYNENGDFVLKGAQVYILNDLKEKYNKINFSMTKDQVISLLGQPDSVSNYTYSTVLEYYVSNKYESVVIDIDNETGLVIEKSICAFSSEDYNIKLSSEIGSKLVDLPSKASSIKEDMTFAQVIAILGSDYFESGRDSDDYYECTWYDINENNITIYFDDEDVAYYIGSVLAD